MKTTLYSLLAAAAALGFAQAQTATTTPVGYVTQALTANSFNLVGLTLQNSPVAAGTFETISGTSLTDNDVTYAPVAGRTYVLEITSGSLIGTIQEVVATSISGSTIITPQDLQAAGLQTTDTYSLRSALTLEEIFGTSTTSVLTRGLSATNADVVWVPTAVAGVYDQYFVHSTTSAFRIAGTTTPAPNVPVIYPDGILVQKKTNPGSMTVTGEVKKVGTNSILGQGISPVNMVAPVGLTLFTAGFETTTGTSGWTRGLGSTNADIVWVPDGLGSYIQYYYNSSAGSPGWRNVATNTATSDVALPSCVFVQRKSATPLNLRLKVPTIYSTL